jgi:predicted site-specific integrase-resolvase
VKDDRFMKVGELAKRVGRSVDTIKRWEEDGLLSCDRDSRGRRMYDESHVELCLRLAELGILAQRRSAKLKTLATAEPVQLSLLLLAEAQRLAS